MSSHEVTVKLTLKKNQEPCYFCSYPVQPIGLDLVERGSGLLVRGCEEMEDEAKIRGIVNCNDPMKKAMTKEVHNLIDVFSGNPEVPSASELKNFSNFSRNREDL